MDLNNREIALIAWTSIAVLAMAAAPDIRRSLDAVIRAFLQPAILVPIGLFAAYVAAWLLAATRAGFWGWDEINDTVVWFLVTGGILFGSFQRVYEQDRYFRKTLRRLVTGALFVEVFINFVVLPLPVELILLLIVTFLAILDAVASSKDEYAPAKKLIDVLMTIIGSAVLIYVAIELITHFKELDASYAARAFAMPVWLTVVSLPFFYGLGLFAAYQRAWKMISFFAEDKIRARRAQRRLPRLGLRARRVGEFNGPWQKEIAHSKDPVAVIRRFREGLPAG